MKTLTISAGTGYFALDRYPLGGDFRRVPRDGPGLKVSVVSTHSRALPTAHGTDTIGVLPDGRKVAFNSSMTDEAEMRRRAQEDTYSAVQDLLNE